MELEMTLYRLTQECVNNALKHARASRITVALRWLDNAVSMEVSDDGIGFEPALYFATLNQAFDSSNGGNGHFGLLNLRERSQAFDGHLIIESQPNAGTIIRVQLPIINPSRTRYASGDTSSL
jgi:signal transduction histidine kinase